MPTPPRSDNAAQLSDDGVFNTVYKNQTVVLFEGATLGVEPIAVDDSTIDYFDSFCNSNFTCFGTVTLHGMAGSSFVQGAINGPGKIEITTKTGGSLVFYAPVAVPGGLHLKRGEIFISADASTTPIVSRGGEDSTVILNGQGRFGTSDFDSNIMYADRRGTLGWGYRRPTIVGNAQLRTHAVLRVNVSPPDSDGITRHIDTLFVEGAVAIDEGATVRIDSGPLLLHPLLPPEGLPLIVAQGAVAGVLTVLNDPQVYRTKWLGSTLYIYAACGTVLKTPPQQVVPASGTFGPNPVCADGVSLVFADDRQCSDTINWLKHGTLDFSLVSTRASQLGGMRGTVPVDVVAPPKGGAAWLSGAISLPAGLTVRSLSDTIHCGNVYLDAVADGTPVTVRNAYLTCAQHVSALTLEQSIVQMSDGGATAPKILRVHGSVDVGASSGLIFHVYTTPDGTRVTSADQLQIEGDLHFDSYAFINTELLLLDAALPADGLPIISVEGTVTGTPMYVEGTYYELIWRDKVMYFRRKA